MGLNQKPQEPLPESEWQFFKNPNTQEKLSFWERFKTPAIIKKQLAVVGIDTKIIIFVLGSLGLLYLVSPSVFPSVGKRYFLGVDLDLWWWGTKALALGSGIGGLIFFLKNLKHRFSWYIPHNQKMLGGFIGVFIASLISSQLIVSNNQDMFKSASEWKRLEAQHIDSRDPVKRQQYAQLIKDNLAPLEELRGQHYVEQVQQYHSTNNNSNVSSNMINVETQQQIEQQKQMLQQLQETNKQIQAELLKQKAQQQVIINHLSEKNK